MTLPSREVIEHARNRNSVSPDWLYTMCQAGCGELVFYPPGAEQAAAKYGTPLVIVCSAECASKRMPKYS